MNTIEKAEKLLEDFQPEHSLFQIEHFIIGTNKHVWERYKQALRELSSRHEGMKSNLAAVEKMEADAEAQPKSKWFDGLFGRKNNNKPNRQVSEFKKKHESKKREYDAFLRIAKELKKEIGEVTFEKRQRLEKEAWVEKARMTMALDLLSIGGLQKSTMEFVTSFPKDLRRQMLSDLKPENRQRLLSVLE